MTGFEPVNLSVADLAGRWIKPSLPHRHYSIIRNLIRLVGLEPTRFAAGDFESPSSANSDTGGYIKALVGFEPTIKELQSSALTTWLQRQISNFNPSWTGLLNRIPPLFNAVLIPFRGGVG